MREYHKIETIFMRDEKTKLLVEGTYRNSSVEFLKDNVWQFTEKIDGTNIRVHWDGHSVSFAGRTDKAQIPKHLLARLEELFGGEVNEEIFEQTFGDKEVTLFGEGYGFKIQTNGYIEGVDFILFDVLVGDVYLERGNVEAIAKTFNIDVVPIILEGTLGDGIDYVRQHHKTSICEGEHGGYMEGLVGRPKVELKTRAGERVIVKIKYNDFKEA
jgi:hypothetical protein